MKGKTLRIAFMPMTWFGFKKNFLRCKDCGVLLMQDDKFQHKIWHGLNSHIALQTELPQIRWR